MNYCKAMLAVAAVTGSTLASAQWYGGLTLGGSNTNIDASSLGVAGATVSSLSKNENDTGYKLQAGYQFTPNFALEGGYVNLGKFNATRNVTAPGVGSVRGEVKVDGWNLMAVGMIPVTPDFSLLGKLGTIYSTTAADLSTTGTVVLASGVLPSYKKSEYNLAYGLGLQYNINKSTSVRGEVESFVDLRPNDAAAKGTVNLYSLGLIFKF